MKKNLSISFFLLILISLLISPKLIKALEIEYPSIGTVEAPSTETVELPSYIRYIFHLAIALTGIIGMGALIYGGILYLISAGKPATLAEAKDQILSAIVGLILLLTSFLILNTINPQLTFLKRPTKEYLEELGVLKGGIEIYSEGDCNGDVVKTSSSIAVLPNALGNPGKSVKIFNEKNELSVFFYSEEDFKGNYTCFGEDPCSSFSKGECKNIGFDAKSVRIEWKTENLPGIHLYAERGCKGDHRYYPTTTSSFPDFNDKARSLKIIPGENEYYVVLHEHVNFKGTCQLYEKNNECINIDLPNGAPSSLHVFSKRNEVIGGEGVAFFKEKNFEGDRLPSTTGDSIKTVSFSDPKKTETTLIYNFKDIYTVTKISLPRIEISRKSEGEIKLGIYLSRDNETWNEIAKPTISGGVIATVFGDDGDDQICEKEEKIQDLYSSSTISKLGAKYIKIHRDSNGVKVEAYHTLAKKFDCWGVDCKSFQKGECLPLPIEEPLYPVFIGTITIKVYKEYFTPRDFSVPNIKAGWLKLEIDGPGKFSGDTPTINIDYKLFGEDFYGSETLSNCGTGCYDMSFVGKEFNDKIKSLQVEGSYVVILFKDADYKNSCEVFTSSDSDLTDNYIRKTTSSFKVRAIK